MGRYDYLKGSKDLSKLPILLTALDAPFQTVSGWETRTSNKNSKWDPEWVVAHHTGAPNVKGHESLDYIIREQNANALIGREPKIFLVANGRVDHAGRGGPFRSVPKDEMNPVGYGIEVEAPGRVQDFAPGQHELLCKLSAAVLWLEGAPVNHLIRHKDWTDGGVDGVGRLETVGRKVDIKYDLGYLRSETQRYMYRLSAIGLPPRPAKPSPAPATKPKVSLAHIKKAIKMDGPAKTGHTTYKDEVLLVENALARLGLLNRRYVDGSAGTSSFGDGSAYQKWQQRLGFRGSDADGIPGLQSLGELGKKYGFDVVK